jgi:RNA polymerase sigma-70 factor (ECF subfamily)
VSSGARELGEAELSDADLVRRALRDHTEFAPLYQRYASRIYWYAFHRLGDHEAAEDAVSIAFERAWAHLGECRHHQFRAWLFTIARNVVTDAQRTPTRSAPLDFAFSVVDPRPGPGEIAAQSEGQQRVHRLLARLPDGQRRIVELRLAGLTGSEIARVLGRSHVAVRVSQYRAYARLRELLEQEPEALDGTH